MKKELMIISLGLMLLTPASNVLGHAGEAHTPGSDTNDSDGGSSLTLEQIYFITILMVIILAFILENRGIVKDRSLVYKLIGFGLIFLTADFFIYREYFA
ncbi:MAG: hypothetical protein GPJ54_01725 [Candidatus Heimdallarchaeota archaeon]|nr:hypothetical protein [Candidatus Heimdallarchaeota archaeon]